jgi:LysM repeat protein
MRIFTIAVGIILSILILTARGTTADAQQTNKPTQKAVQKATTKPKKVIVTVKRGDTLIKIAKKHKTTYPKLFDANKQIKKVDLIYPGDKIRIPNKNEKLKHRVLSAVASMKKHNTYSAPANHINYIKSSAPTIYIGNTVWDRIAQCESGGNWSINTGNGYYGGLQFTLSSWRGVGGTGYPNQASRLEQIKRAQILQSRSGWGNWPACTARLGIG